MPLCCWSLSGISKKGDSFYTLLRIVYTVHSYTAYPLEYKPLPLRHQNKHFQVHLVFSGSQLRNNCINFRILCAPRKGGHLTQGVGASLCNLLLWRPRQVLRCREAGLNPLCSLHAECNCKLLCSLPSPWGLHCPSKRIPGSPKVVAHKDKKNWQSQFPWCQGTG